MLAFALIVLTGYIVGAIPTGYLVAKYLSGIDIRTIGSGSTGATNVMRACGKGAAAFVMLCDMLKGVFPVLLAIHSEVAALEVRHHALAELHLLAPLTALATLIGHSRSIFLGFKGGKSAATALGTLLALNFKVAAVVFISWGLLVFATQIVSVASMTAGVLSILCMIWFHAYFSYTGYCIVGSICILYLHRANIKRLFEGTEPKIGQKLKN